MDALDDKKAGETVDVLLVRNGEKQTITLTLTADADIKSLLLSSILSIRYPRFTGAR